MNRSNKIKTRLAPSPTGVMHIGTARTALFNYIFAKQQNGSFIVRIEDTDKNRSKPEFEKNILNGLVWLNLTPDEPITRQSERTEIYKKYLTQLIEENKAYYCYCTKEELEAEKAEMLAAGLAPKYSGRCRYHPPSGRKPTLIRLKTDSNEISFSDKIRGCISFKEEALGDFPIAKNLTLPLFNFAVVIDDYEMDITHVIRGEDHISNTPRQILIYQALGWKMPIYAHIPLIMSAGGGKLSKRDNTTTSIDEYRSLGYLPEALINFLALMGWHPKNNCEILSLAEIMKYFRLEDVQKGGAIFNQAKLDWLNNHYLRAKSDDELLTLSKKIVPVDWLKDEAKLKQIISLQKERLNNLFELKEAGALFFALPEYNPSDLLWQETSPEIAKTHLLKCLDFIKQDFLSADSHITAYADKEGRGEVYWPLRLALSGQKKSPPPFAIMKIIGQSESVERLKIAVNKINSLC